jgi:hypothetical protein
LVLIFVNFPFFVFGIGLYVAQLPVESAAAPAAAAASPPAGENFSKVGSVLISYSKLTSKLFLENLYLQPLQLLLRVVNGT